LTIRERLSVMGERQMIIAACAPQASLELNNQAVDAWFNEVEFNTTFE
jgi:hypothetical protein